MCMVIHPEVIETVCLTHKCQPACVALKKQNKTKKAGDSLPGDHSHLNQLSRQSIQLGVELF